MISKKDKNADRKVRHARVRKNLSGTSLRPRLDVYRSTKYIYAQIIDDVAGRTLVSASSLRDERRACRKNKCEEAKAVGLAVGKKRLKRA